MKKVILMMLPVMAFLGSCSNSEPKMDKPVSTLNGHKQDVDANYASNLKSSDQNDLANPVMTIRLEDNLFKSERARGILLELGVRNPGKDHVWIDLNGNGKEDEGETVKSFNQPDPKAIPVTYKVETPELHIYGKVNYLNIENAAKKWFTALEVKHNPYLEILYADDNKISELDLSKNKVLRILSVVNNNLESIEVDKLPMLEQLWVSRNSISSLDVSKNIELKGLHCDNNLLRDVDLSHNIYLRSFTCSSNPDFKLDLHANTQMQYLIAAGIKMKNIDLSNLHNLKWLFVSENELENIDLSKNPFLEIIDLGFNKLTKIDVSKNLLLETLFVSNNKIKSLNLNGLPNLNRIVCEDNELDANAINDIFRALPNKKGVKKPYDFYYTYDLRENPGMPYCDDKIAEDKGWTANLEDDKYLILGGKWDPEDAKKTVFN